jgi:cell division septal protein FtsQ
MGKAEKDVKREERKQRSEAERLHREAMKRSQKMRGRAFIVVGLLAVIGVVAVTFMRRQDREGLIWSAEHGHYHNAQGQEIRR